MGGVRVPYLLAELKERGCVDESVLAQVMQLGCWIEEDELRKLAVKLGVGVSELAPAPENVANTRFKAKLRGGLASFLFEYDGCFRHAEGSSHAEMLGIEQEGDIGLPSRAADAMLLEKTLYQIIARAKYMLGKIDSKFVRSEQSIVFREQLAPGIFKPGYRGFRFKEIATGDLPTVMIDGRKFNCVTSIARAHGLDPVTVRRRIADTKKGADKLTNDEWKLILAKKKGKGKPFTYLGKTYSNIAQFCREHQLNTNLVYQKVKDRADSADEEFWGQIIETCKRKYFVQELSAVKVY